MCHAKACTVPGPEWYIHMYFNYMHTHTTHHQAMCTCLLSYLCTPVRSHCWSSCVQISDPEDSLIFIIMCNNADQYILLL